MIEPIHKQAILKLINCFTTSPPLDVANAAASNGAIILDHDLHADDQDAIDAVLLHRFKDHLPSIDLPALSRLGVIILKFEKVFAQTTSSLLNNNDGSPHPLLPANVKLPFSSANQIYLQQMPSLVSYIEEANLFGPLKTLGLDPAITIEHVQQLQPSQHVQALIMLIRDWLCQFYTQKDIINSLFPLVNSTDNLFSLIDIKENNICILSLLIFNIFYKLRDSFPEYKLLLEFSWIIFTGLVERFVEMVNINTEYILGLVQTSLLCAKLEDEQEVAINSGLHKQIEGLRGKIIETKKRIQTLALSKQSNQHPHQQQQQLQHQIKPSSGGGGNDQQLVRVTTTARPTTSSSSVAPIKSAMSGHNSKSTTTFIYSGMDKPFKCGVCLKTFPTSYKLNRHAYSHSGERPYMCNWPNCLKRFNDNYHLRRHMNTHTGEKPFPCKYPGCNKRYSRSEDLRNHQKTHYSLGSAESVALTANGNGTDGAGGGGGHHANTDAANLNVLVQSASNSLASPVSFSLASTALSPLSASKASLRQLTADHGNADPQLVLQLNQLQQQLQLQSQQQQQQAAVQQQQQSFTTAMSPNQVLGDDSALQPGIILQDVANAAASANQNHVANSLHINDNYF